MKKAIVIFTTFFDADAIIDDGFLLYHYPNSKTVYKFNFTNNPSNHSVYSIALSSPKKNFKHISHFPRLDFFCPTYDMLCEYKDGKDWKLYTNKYLSLMKARKKQIQEWVMSLEKGHIYVLCCWENTRGQAHCHRDIVFKTFSNSEWIKSRIFPIYRDGGSKKEPLNIPSPEFQGEDGVADPIYMTNGSVITTTYGVGTGLDDLTQALTRNVSFDRIDPFMLDDDGDNPGND